MPEEMTFEETVEYAKNHLDEIPLNEFVLMKKINKNEEV